MELKKYLKRIAQGKKEYHRAEEKGQSIIEYALLVAIAITALLAVNFLADTRDTAFTSHFENVAHCLAPEAF